MIKPRAELTIRYSAPEGGRPLCVHVRNSEDALYRARHLAEFVDRSTLILVSDEGREFTLAEFERAMGARPVPQRRPLPDARGLDPDSIAMPGLPAISVSEAESSPA